MILIMLWPYPPTWARCMMALVACAVVALGMGIALAIISLQEPRQRG